MMEMDLVGRVDVLNGFEAPFDIINKSGTKKNGNAKAMSAIAARTPCGTLARKNLYDAMS